MSNKEIAKILNSKFSLYITLISSRSNYFGTMGYY